MADGIASIMDFCQESGNKHLQRFSKTLDRHWEGIVAHGYYRISSGRVEGVNSPVKTVRRRAYGYREDDYFFLKIMDASRRMNTSERESREAKPAKNALRNSQEPSFAGKLHEKFLQAWQARPPKHLIRVQKATDGLQIA